MNDTENATFLSAVVKEIKDHFRDAPYRQRPFDYKLELIEKICDLPVKVVITFAHANSGLYYSIYIIHSIIRACLCGDRYILYFNNYGVIEFENINNQFVFDIFHRTANILPRLRFDIARGILTTDPLLSDQLIFFDKLLAMATTATTATNIKYRFEECVVCYNKTKTTLRCEHICCIMCLTKITNRKCPVCRKKILTVNIPDSYRAGYRKRFSGREYCQVVGGEIYDDAAEAAEEDYAEEAEDEAEEDSERDEYTDDEEPNIANPRVIPANSRILIMDSQIPEERNAITHTIRDVVNAIIEDERLFSANPFQERDEQERDESGDPPLLDPTNDNIHHYSEIEPSEDLSCEIDEE